MRFSCIVCQRIAVRRSRRTSSMVRRAVSGTRRRTACTFRRGSWRSSWVARNSNSGERRMVQEGDRAPEFTAKTDAGTALSLRDLHGKNVVLYFYPKDDTPGCTIEACELRDAFPRFATDNAVILGVSPDTVESHVKFKKKFD